MTSTANLPSADRRFLQRPVHHVGILVPDLRGAVDHWARVYGAGPFFALEDIAFDQCIADGRPATFAHSAAFGQWGSIRVELMEFHDVQPPHLAEQLAPSTASAIHHVAVAVDDAAAERDRLASLGMPSFIAAALGEIEVTFHDATETLGHLIEVHQAGPALDAHFATVKSGSDGWDGRDPFRTF